MKFNRSLVLLLVFVLCSQAKAQSSSEAPIKIGALMILSGDFAMQGAAFREGVELAKEEINQTGGVAGHPLEIVIEDTHSDPKRANLAARKLIDIDRVVAAITTSYPETAVGGAQFESAKIPSIALWDSSPQIDAMGEYIFAIGPWTPSDAEVGASFCSQELKAKTAVIINNVEEWSELIGNLFADEFQKNGGKVVDRVRINPGEADFRTVLAKIKAVKPDVVYVPLTNDVVAFHTQALQMDLKIPRVSAGIITEEHISKNPAAFEGVYQSQIRDPERKEIEKLAKSYAIKFKKPMTMPWFVATGYDGIKLLAYAIDKVGPHSKQIKEFLYSIKNYPGAAQDITINAAGSSPYFASMFVVQSGKFTLVPNNSLQ